METYHGLVRTPTDAIILFEACRLGILPRVQRRLSEKERQSIRSGSVFVWDEREAGMRRCTDGKGWSASRVSGSFLTYREMEGKRGGSSFASSTNRGTKTPDSGDDPQGGDGDDGPDGYRYKPDGLMKQSFSITTSQGQHLHLISYYARSSPSAQVLRQPSNDPSLASIQPAKGMYPESTVGDQSSVPAVTRSPMAGAPNYIMAGSPSYARAPPPHPHAYIAPGYMPHPAYMAYPISPMHTPPGYALHPYATHPGLPPLAYHPNPYGQPPHLPVNQAPSSIYDQRPLRHSESGPSQHPPSLQPQQSAPPAPYTQSQPPPPLSPRSQSMSQAAGHNRTYSVPMTSQSQTQNPTVEKATASYQIDPRLTAGVQNDNHSSSPKRGEESTNASRPLSNGIITTATHAPTIGALVNGGMPTGMEDKPQGEKEVDRQGSVSPGGTKYGAPPQDIPSEKLGFREDKRALSMLDRAFARV